MELGNMQGTRVGPYNSSRMVKYTLKLSKGNIHICQMWLVTAVGNNVI